MTLDEDLLADEFVAAVRANDEDRLRSLISLPMNVDTRLRDALRRPLICWAAEHADIDVVELLLNAGANVDAVDDIGDTACHIVVAGRRGREDVLAALLEAQPNLDGVNNKSQTPLHVALSRDQHNMAEMLLEANAPLREKLCELLGVSTRAIQALIDHEFDVSALCCSTGFTPLHAAAEVLEHSVDAANMLIHVCGLDLEQRFRRFMGGEGETCTMLALNEFNTDLVRCFVEGGADVNRQLRDGHSTLMLAQDHESIIVLLAAGADVHKRNRGGFTVTRLFCDDRHRGRGFIDGLTALLGGGADVDAEEPDAYSVRRLMDCDGLTIDDGDIELARRDIAKVRLDFVRHRALDVCIGLQSLRIDALSMCEVLLHACGPHAPLIQFHHWWAIATTVKHSKLEK